MRTIRGGLSINWTRWPFIGATSRGRYIEEVLSEAEKETLSSVVNRLNREIENAELYLSWSTPGFGAIITWPNSFGKINTLFLILLREP